MTAADNVRAELLEVLEIVQQTQLAFMKTEEKIHDLQQRLLLLDLRMPEYRHIQSAVRYAVDIGNEFYMDKESLIAIHNDLTDLLRVI